MEAVILIVKTLIRRIYRVYFGTPGRAFVFVIALIVFMVFYMNFVSKFLFSSRGNVERIKNELSDTRAELSQTKELLAKITSASGLQYSLAFKPLDFNEPAESSLLRSLDYAKYALTKDDFEYAKRLLEDATAIQKTPATEYLLGVLAFKSGDLKKASEHWQFAVQTKNVRNQAEILYLLIVASHEQGDAESTSNYMEQYIQIQKP